MLVGMAGAAVALTAVSAAAAVLPEHMPRSEGELTVSSGFVFQWQKQGAPVLYNHTGILAGVVGDMTIFIQKATLS